MSSQNGNLNEEPDTKNKVSEKSSMIPSSYVWAFVFAIVIAGWMLSGPLMKGEDIIPKKSVEKSDAKASSGNKQEKLFRVQTETFLSMQRRANIIVRGRTEVEARVQIKAQTAGVVEKIATVKGAWVNKGDTLCHIETAERDSTLLQAKAQVAQRQADYDANQALAKQGHTAQLRMTTYKARLDASKAELKKAEIDYNRTKIRAPFRGFVEDQHAKVGDYLMVGMPCVTLVALDPLTIVGYVSELEVVSLQVGAPASVKLVTGEEGQGKISFISASADQATRTFRVEVEIDNKNAKLRDGITTDINIPLSETKAHLFSPAILVLNDEGQIGVRTVDENNTVIFMPVQLLSDNEKGVWVSGLPDKVRVITVGQEYVLNNQKVSVTENFVKKPKKRQQDNKS